jgi:hypothetical protein
MDKETIIALFKEYRDRALALDLNVSNTIEIDGISYLFEENKQEIGEYNIYVTDWQEDMEELILDESVTGIIRKNSSKKSKLKKVVLSDSVKLLDRDSFISCTELTDINLSNVEYIGSNAFKGCSKLETVNFGSNLSYLGNRAFSHTGLRSVEFNSKLRSLCSSCFSFCYNLESISNLDCERLLDITAQAKYNQGVHEGIFKGCMNLKSATIKYVDFVSKDMFRNCTSLEEVYFKQNTVNMCEDAFYNCVSLKDIYAKDNLNLRGVCFCNSVNVHAKAFESVEECRGTAFHFFTE